MSKRNRSGSGEQYRQDDEKRQMITTRANAEALNVALQDIQVCTQDFNTLLNGGGTMEQIQNAGQRVELAWSYYNRLAASFN